MDKDDLGNVEFSGKVKIQTFKQFQLDRLIKEGKVIPASKLAAAKEIELQRARDFEVSMGDEERNRRSTPAALKDKLLNLPLTRERFED